MPNEKPPDEKPPGLLSRYRNGLAELRQPGQIAGGARNYMAGLLAQTPTQNIQQAAAMGIPGASDVAGLLADGMMYNSSPESRTPANYLLSALGALPFVPNVAGTLKTPRKLYRGTREGKGIGAYTMGKGLYSSPDRSKAALYGKVEEIPIDVGMPRNPLVIPGGGRGDSHGIFRDWLLDASGEKNIRDFNAKYKDPGDFVKSLGYDGVWIGDEVVKY